MPDDDTNLTTGKLRRACLAVLESRAAEGDFWAAMMAKHGVQQVRFCAHLPDDDHAYVMAAIPWLNQPATLILPERWRRELPPLPRLLTGEDC
jgi:hypothetical protein